MTSRVTEIGFKKSPCLCPRAEKETELSEIVFSQITIVQSHPQHQQSPPQHQPLNCAVKKSKVEMKFELYKPLQPLHSPPHAERCRRILLVSCPGRHDMGTGAIIPGDNIDQATSIKITVTDHRPMQPEFSAASNRRFTGVPQSDLESDNHNTAGPVGQVIVSALPQTVLRRFRSHRRTCHPSICHPRALPTSTSDPVAPSALPESTRRVAAVRLAGALLLLLLCVGGAGTSGALPSCGGASDPVRRGGIAGTCWRRATAGGGLCGRLRLRGAGPAGNSLPGPRATAATTAQPPRGGRGGKSWAVRQVCTETMSGRASKGRMKEVK
jgi:hypothetical protein